MGDRVLVVGCDRPAVDGNRVRDPVPARQHVREVGQGAGMVRPGLEGGAVLPLGFLEPALVQEHVSQVEAGLGVLRRDLEHPPVPQDRLIRPSQASQQVPQVVVAIGVLGMRLQQGAIDRLGFCLVAQRVGDGRPAVVTDDRDAFFHDLVHEGVVVDHFTVESPHPPRRPPGRVHIPHTPVHLNQQDMGGARAGLQGGDALQVAATHLKIPGGQREAPQPELARGTARVQRCGPSVVVTRRPGLAGLLQQLRPQQLAWRITR